MSAEYLLPIQDFTGSVTYYEPYEARLAELLRPATRSAAEIYKAVVPSGLWYRAVFKGDDKNSQDKDAFKKEFDLHAAKRFGLRSTVTYIDRHWRPHSVASWSTVKSALHVTQGQLDAPIAFVEANAPDATAQEFGHYLADQKRHLKEGELEKLMTEFLKLSTDQRIVWTCMFAEYLDDHLLGIKSSPEAFLARVLRGKTEEANKRVALYDKAIMDLYSYTIVKPRVFVADMDISSGFLGLGDRRISGLNNPNFVSDDVALHIFPKRIDSKNRNTIAPLAETYLGFTTTAEDLETFVLLHETSHGDRWEGEVERLGSKRSHVKEGAANFMGLVVGAYRDVPEEQLLKAVKGFLGYSLDDIEQKGRGSVYESFGWQQPSVEELLDTDNPYKFSAYVALRKGNFLKAIRHPVGVVNLDRFMPFAERMDREFRDLARIGIEDGVAKYAGDILGEIRFYPVTAAVKEILAKVNTSLHQRFKSTKVA